MGHLRRLIVALLAALPLTTFAAPEFPPGVFSDGGEYQVDDFAGKLLVLIFYEQKCPKCRDAVPDYNALAQTFADEPVYVLAVAAEDSQDDAARYMQSTRMQIPMFVDNAGLLSDAYGFDISLKNIRQCALVMPDGEVQNVGWQMDKVEARVREALAEAAWTFDRAEYPPIMEPVLRELELGRWNFALQKLQPALRSRDDAVKAAAEKIMTLAESEADAQLAAADEALEAGDTLGAFILYEQVAQDFATLKEQAKTARKAAMPLRRDEAVRSEFDARKRYVQLVQGLRRAAPEQTNEVLGFARQLVADFPGTPTAARVESWLNSN